MKYSKKYAVGTLAVGLLILGYLAKTLYDRGVYSDVSGTSGYTTYFEIFLIIVGLSLCVAGFINLMTSKRKY